MHAVSKLSILEFFQNFLTKINCLCDYQLNKGFTIYNYFTSSVKRKTPFKSPHQHFLKAHPFQAVCWMQLPVNWDGTRCSKRKPSEAGVRQRGWCDSTLIGSQQRTENIPFPSKVPAPNTSATGSMKGLEKFPPGPAQPETGQWAHVGPLLN